MHTPISSHFCKCPRKITQLNGSELQESFFLRQQGSGSCHRNPARPPQPSLLTGQLPEGERAFAQGGSGCLSSGNMADKARPAQQLLVSNTLQLIYPCLTPGESHERSHPPIRAYICLPTALHIQTSKSAV